MYYVTILHPSTTWIDTMWANVATYYQQLKELSLRQSLTTGMIMTRPVSPWSPWHLLETLSTCLTISPTASTAQFLKTYSYFKHISCVLRWHIWLLKPWLTRVWQWWIRPRVLLPSDFKWVSSQLWCIPQSQQWQWASKLNELLTVNCCFDRGAHQNRERRISTKATTGATS